MAPRLVRCSPAPSALRRPASSCPRSAPCSLAVRSLRPSRARAATSRSSDCPARCGVWDFRLTTLASSKRSRHGAACSSPSGANRARPTRSRSCTRTAAETRQLEPGRADSDAFRSSGTCFQDTDSCERSRVLRNRPSCGAPLLQLQGWSAVRDNASTDEYSAPMTETTRPFGVPVNTSAGHLSVHVDGLHPDDVPFLFEQQPKRMGLSLLASATFDVVAATLLILASRYTPAPTETFLPELLNTNMVFLSQPGPGGGGGGGGKKRKEPPRPAQQPGKVKSTA